MRYQEPGKAFYRTLEHVMEGSLAIYIIFVSIHPCILGHFRESLGLCVVRIGESVIYLTQLLREKILLHSMIILFG